MATDVESFADDDQRGLIDVTDKSLAEVQALPEDVVGDALRRILADVEGGIEPVIYVQLAT